MKSLIISVLAMTTLWDIWVVYMSLNEPSVLCTAAAFISGGCTVSIIRDAIKLWHLET
jgi:hypothetical protein